MILAYKQMHDWPLRQRGFGNYEYAKPLGAPGMTLRNRVRAAWLVLIGRAAAVRWY